VPHVWQQENIEGLVTNTLPTLFTYFRYPKQLENWPESAEGFLEAEKN